MPSDLDTEARILEAAHGVFVRRGVAAARTQEIADEAGVNKALLHYYFRSKGALADAVFLRAARGMFPRMLAALAADVSLRDRLQGAIEVELELLGSSPFLPGYILCELRAEPERLSALVRESVPVERLEADVFAPLQRQIDAEVAAGRMRPTGARALVVAMMSMLIFPHAASHMLELVAGLDDAARADLTEWRRRDLADFLLRGFVP